MKTSLLITTFIFLILISGCKKDDLNPINNFDTTSNVIDTTQIIDTTSIVDNNQDINNDDTTLTYYGYGICNKTEIQNKYDGDTIFITISFNLFTKRYEDRYLINFSNQYDANHMLESDTLYGGFINLNSDDSTLILQFNLNKITNQNISDDTRNYMIDQLHFKYNIKLKSVNATWKRFLFYPSSNQSTDVILSNSINNCDLMTEADFKMNLIN